MKVFGKQSISQVFYWLSKIGFYISCGFCILFTALLGIATFTYFTNIDNSIAVLQLPTNVHPHLALKMPFLDGSISAKQNGFMEYALFAVIFITFSFYILLFRELSLLFKGFASNKIFRIHVYKHLMMLAHLILFAAVVLCILVWFSPSGDSDILLGIVLVAVAGLLYFIAQIFKQAIPLQEEQDLTV